MTQNRRRWSYTAAQRVVLSIGLGVGLYIAAAAVAGWATSHSSTGWLNYAPGSSITFSPGPINGWAVATWLMAAALWTAASLRIFRERHDPPQHDHDELD